jgi:hypothetical protein
MKKIALFLLLHLCISSTSGAQNFSQTVRGVVLEESTEVPLIGAFVRVTADSFDATFVTNDDGRFKIQGVPVGRINVDITYVGFERVRYNQLELDNHKELVLKVIMQEEAFTGSEVIVKAKKDKSATNNKLVSVSGRTFSVEESNRYAGSRGDVARMAQNFAGVQGANDSRNDIIVRGNSPIGVLYRLEGIDIPNPNHFAAAGTTGGPISMLNNNVLSNSDFLTGAFPAEYGNALAAVFDIKMRNGNNEQHEFLGQIGFAGLELMAEGPFSKKSRASFLVNYRYSTLGVFKALGVNFGTGAAVPEYQDFSFKLNFPGEKGSLSIFGVGGLSQVNLFQSEEAGENLFRNDFEDLQYRTNTGIIGIAKTHRLTSKTYMSVTLSANAAETFTNLDTFSKDNDGNIQNYAGLYRDNSYQGKFTLHGFVRHKFNSRNLFKAGIVADRNFFSLQDSFFINAWNTWIQPTNFKGHTYIFQPYVQHLFKLNTKLNFTAGLHYQHYAYNDANSLEPRVGASYKLASRQKLSLGVGLHSQVAPFRIYFEEAVDPLGNRSRLNENLGMTRAWHFVLSHDFSIGKNKRLKTEVYYQHLFDVPVDGAIIDAYSLLNQGADFGILFRDQMVNTGTGENYGLEITFEQFLTEGFYYLNTLSLFRSFYTGSNGLRFPTAFDSRFAFNSLIGKEFYFRVKTAQKPGKKVTKNSLTTDLRIMANGGRRHTPVHVEQSRLEGRTVYDVSRTNSLQYAPYARVDFRVAFKSQGNRVSQEWGIDIQNVFNRKNIFNQSFNATTGEFRTTYQTGILPIGLYRILF